MDEFNLARKSGAHIFRLAAKMINTHGWHGSSMDILLSVTPGHRWPQPMAVLMYSELSNALGPLTLTQFDRAVKGKAQVIELFEKVALALELPN